MCHLVYIFKFFQFSCVFAEARLCTIVGYCPEKGCEVFDILFFINSDTWISICVSLCHYAFAVFILKGLFWHCNYHQVYRCYCVCLCRIMYLYVRACFSCSICKHLQSFSVLFVCMVVFLCLCASLYVHMYICTYVHIALGVWWNYLLCI